MTTTTTRAATTPGGIDPVHDATSTGVITPHRPPPVVLVVDQNPTLLRAVLWSLRSEQIRVVGAVDADEAFSLLERNPIDVLICDDATPGMRGSTLLDEVRRRYPDTGRIVLTGDASTPGTAHDAHMTRPHVKPCPGPELVASINAVLAERALHPGAGCDDSCHGVDHPHLDAALAQSWIALQPIFRAGTHTVFGHEVLVRGDLPGFTTAPQLVDAATGLSRLVDLDRAVRHHVLDVIDRLPVHSRVFINLTTESLHDDDLFRDDARLHRYASRVVFEIAARAPIDTISDAADRIAGLKELGYRIALDDFGADDASLAGKMMLKPEIVKFEPALVRQVEWSAPHRRTLASVIASCRASGVLTLAEAVETAAEAECLGGLGCDLLQGYRFGRPRRWPAHLRDLV
jgi:EAL domain-containing protein (putative c-di-GMP-specific phosphodiesterase class I)